MVLWSGSRIRICGFCDSGEAIVTSELIFGEIWVSCYICGHTTKYFPNGGIELWNAEKGDVVMSFVKTLKEATP